MSALTYGNSSSSRRMGFPVNAPAFPKCDAPQVEASADTTHNRSRRLMLDWFERLVVLAFYVALVVRLLHRGFVGHEAGRLLLLPSEGAVVLFIFLRRETTNITLELKDWLLSFAATVAPLMVVPGTSQPIAPAAVCAGVLLMGIVVQVHAKLTLGRSFGCVPAHRGLQLTGPYQWVRHPMYAGYLLSHAAFLLMNPAAWNLLTYTVCYALQIPRLLAEERWLSNDPRYQAYRAVVRYRLLPGVF